MSIFEKKLQFAAVSTRVRGGITERVVAFAGEENRGSEPLFKHPDAPWLYETPADRSCMWTADALRQIADKLDELNRERDPSTHVHWVCPACGWTTETAGAAGVCCGCGTPCRPVENRAPRKIDIGCGSGPKRPAPGFDAYCDIHDPSVVTARPYYQCPMEDMHVFGNKEFDYARCHHVIEHVNDPNKACAELIRIAKGGIISFPTMQAELLFGRRDHNFFVTIDHGRLLFIRKRHPCYGVPRAVSGAELNVDFAWEGSFQWLVIE